jgi:hypothetical protein
LAIILAVSWFWRKNDLQSLLENEKGSRVRQRYELSGFPVEGKAMLKFSRRSLLGGMLGTLASWLGGGTMGQAKCTLTPRKNACMSSPNVAT